MQQLSYRPCRKCGGDTTIHWNSGTKLQEGSMKRTCSRCGFDETIDDLESKRLTSY